MGSFSPLPNAPFVSDPALSPGRLFPSPLPSLLPPLTAASPPSLFPQELPPSPSTDPPPATAPPPSRPPVPPPIPPTNPPLPLSPIPPANSPPPASPIPSSNSTPPPPPPSSTLLANNSPPPISPPPLPSPPASSPPPPPPPPPPTSPREFQPTPLSDLPASSPPLPSFRPPPIPPPPRNSQSIPSPPSSVRSRNSPSIPPPPSSVRSRNSPSIPPPPSSVRSRNSPSILPPPISSPPPRTPPSLRHASHSSPPPVITVRPPTHPSIDSSSPPGIEDSTPPFRSTTPSPSVVLISPPGISNINDWSPSRLSSNGGIGTGGIVGVTAVLGIVLLTTILTVLWCLFKRKKKIAGHDGLYHLSTSMGNISHSSLLKIQTSEVEIGNISANDFVYSPQEPGGLGNSSRFNFTYEDLVEATNGFSPQNLLGSGGFGYVYKGYLADGTEVAVKDLKIGGGQGEREFRAEVEIISRIHHRYLVSLVGYCIFENKRLLVYEYVPNNTLYYHLHVSELVLDWPTRVRVASGAARGIAYLHEDCHPRVIHRDIKSSNILLDKDFEARVSDFGLAKLAADVNTHVTTRVMGTFGYMAPEYARSGMLSEKSDVFSFGVVLLELITGRKPVDVSLSLGDEGLVEWARPLLSHALETEDLKALVDPKLGMNFVPNEMFRMIEAAAACVRHSATKRPRMGQVVRAFEGLETEDLNNGMRVGQSEIFNSAQQSAEVKLFHRMAFSSRNYSTDYFTLGSYPPNSN